MSVRRQNILLLVLALSIATVALAAVLLPPVALNPNNTDAVAFGKVRIIGEPDGAFLNLTPHAIAPLSPDESGLFILNTASVHQLCVRIDGDNHCVNATLVP